MYLQATQTVLMLAVITCGISCQATLTSSILQFGHRDG